MRHVTAAQTHVGSSLCEAMVPLALRVAWLLREEPLGAARVLSKLDPAETRALALVACAAIDVDASAEELLGWTRTNVLRLTHGTHAGFNRHKAAGEIPCASCAEGERDFQRTRRARQRRKAS